MRMKIRVYILVVLAALLFMVSIAPQALADAQSAQSKEYQIKAAFLYNFIKFVDWPKEKIADSNKPITIGIIGKYPFGKAFEPVKNKKIGNRPVAIKHFKSLSEFDEASAKDKASLARMLKALSKCRLLFVCSSEKKRLDEIIAAVQGCPVLTVGENAGFLETGGIINFLVEHKKVRFEINLIAAKKAKLKIRSKLMRLAKRVIKEESSDTKEADNG